MSKLTRILLGATTATAMAAGAVQAETVTIATVNNGDMIRMQELALKQQDLQRKITEDQTDAAMEAAKMQQRAATDAARIELQEDIADERNMVNRERIAVQRENMLRRTS